MKQMLKDRRFRKVYILVLQYILWKGVKMNRYLKMGIILLILLVLSLCFVECAISGGGDSDADPWNETLEHAWEEVMLIRPPIFGGPLNDGDADPWNETP